MLPQLSPRPLRLQLGPRISHVGFAVDDYEAVLAALSELSFEGAPERAVNKRRAEFLAGRLAASHALEQLGVAGALGRNADGSPRWPVGVVGSITHGARRAFCAVAQSEQLRGLGIDAEALMRASTSPELKRRICSEGELRCLASALAAPEHHLLSLAFSAKESLYKCLYPLVERFMDFHAARVVAVTQLPAHDGIEGELTLELSVDWSPQHLAGRRLCARFFLGAEHVETAVELAA